MEINLLATPIPKKKYYKLFTYFQEILSPLTKSLAAKDDLMETITYLCTKLGGSTAIPYVKQLVKAVVTNDMRIEHKRGIIIAAYLLVSAKAFGKDELHINHAERRKAQSVLQDTSSALQIQYWMHVLSESWQYKEIPLNGIEGYESQKQRIKPWSGIASMIQIDYEKRLQNYPIWKACIEERIQYYKSQLEKDGTAS